MLGIDRADEPYYEDCDESIAQMKQDAFEYLQFCGLNIVELKEVFRDIESYEYNEIEKPDYTSEK